MYSPAIARYLLHHVFLPPKTPQKNDFCSEFGDTFLDLVIDSLNDHGKRNTGLAKGVIDSLIEMCNNMRSLHEEATQDVIESELLKALRATVEQGGCVPIYVRAQNAAVLVWNVDGEIRFDAFEVAPLNEAAMTTRGRLKRTFPDVAVAIEQCTAFEPGFCEQIAKTLAQMSHQPVPGQQPQVKKAGMLHDEDRDTTDPGMVTGFFSHVLAGLGEFAAVEGIAKNTREQVTWLDAKSPWRRAPMWLVVRVALGTAFLRWVPDAAEARERYKEFMITLMSRIMRLAPMSELSSDELYIMNAKLSRRLIKQPGIATDVLEAARSALTSIHDELGRRWKLRQQHDVSALDLTRLGALDFTQDTHLEFPGIDDFLHAIENTARDRKVRRFQPVSGMIIYRDDILPRIGPSDNTIALHAFENWVATHLDQWSDKQSPADACVQLANVLEAYHTRANQCYVNNPQAISLMVLVTVELWIACDQFALAICPILKDYQPGVQKSVLQNLLLPVESQVQRLAAVERYLDMRETATYPTSGLFQSTSVNSFGVRFFNQSSDHQSLLQAIERRAEGDREDKLQEWRTKRNEYQTLMQAYDDRASCDFEEVVIDHRFNMTQTYHSSACVKCNYKTRAAALTIDVHEWPLPRNSELAKTVIFELSLPLWFGHWRDAVFYVQHDVLHAKYERLSQPDSKRYLANDPHLANKFCTTRGLRVGLLSATKPHVGTHRRGKELATATETTVCVNNGLSYRYFDSQTSCFVHDISTTETIPQACTYQLPSRSRAMQRFLYRPFAHPNGPMPNVVISSQSECPDHLSLQEYKDLCSIPLGVDLQWIDIATQLFAPSVDLNKIETGFIILQCIYQVGSPASDYSTRPIHIILMELEYGNSLLQGLDEALSRIESNWESTRALDILCAVARRLLSSTGFESIRRACLEYLHKARCVAMNWTMLLNNKCREAQCEADRLEFQRRGLETALVCVSTFDLDTALRFQALSTSDDAATLLRCSIIIRHLEHVLDDLQDGRSQVLHERHLRVLYDAVDRMAVDQIALNDAIGKACVFYRDGRAWTVVDGTAHWVQSAFTPEGSGLSSEVHFNLLTGELLVNGSPLDRLPTAYEDCELYKTLFGTSAIEVIPNSSSAMEYSSKEDYHGYRLQFGWCQRDRKASTLLVQASSAQTRYLLLPADIFQGSLPETFVTNFVHWYDTGEKTVEFRPRDQPWSHDSPKLWTLRQSGEDSKWQLVRPRNGTYIVGTKSETVGLLSKILAPLAKPLQIHAHFHPNSRCLEIAFAGINLGFLLKEGHADLISRDFSGMMVDPDQSLGTLIGFRNKLMLTNGSKRTVLVVEGSVSLHPPQDLGSMTGTGVTASVDLLGTRLVHPFVVDTQLRRLTGKETLSSALYLAYILALTSFCLTDPLTGKTGTEQALTILRSATVRSFDRLSQNEVDLLQSIAQLTPARAFYPHHERVMESIGWHSTLGPLAQHAGFYDAVKSIIAHAQRSRMFYPQDKVTFPRFDNLCTELLQRDRIRSSAFRVPGYGAEDFTTDHDVKYQGRLHSAKREKSARVLSHAIYRDIRTRHWKPLPTGSFWCLMQKIGSTEGLRNRISTSEIKYDAKHIVAGKTFVARNWLALHQLLFERDDPNLSKFAVIFWLGTLAYSTLGNEILEVLAQGYVSNPFGSANVPRCETFCISEGTDVRPHIRNQLEHHLRDFHNCPENSLTQMTYESRKEFGRRVKRLFETNQQQAVRSLESSLQEQWQRARASIPSEGEVPIATYINVTKAVAKVNKMFESCFSNRCLKQYFEAIEMTSARLSQQDISLPVRKDVAVKSYCAAPGYIHINDLFTRPISSVHSGSLVPQAYFRPQEQRDCGRLQQFMNELGGSTDHSAYYRMYVDKLEQSLEALRKNTTQQQAAAPDLDSVRAYHTFCADQLRRIETTLNKAVTHTRLHHERHVAAGEAIGHSARITPDFFLGRLNSRFWRSLDESWRVGIAAYGLAFTALQRAERTLAALESGSASDAAKEWEQVGHRNWDPMSHPESLLLEVESGILIRDAQEQIAHHMRAPEKNRNTSMQLNMGEGKSSVIVPMVCLYLADGSRLVRVLAAKPQFKQMTQMLISKLGGLLNRRVYYLPFSRSLRPNTAMIEAIDSICRECMKEGGVLLVQPEHLLSFQLMVLERPICGEEAVGRSLLRIHRFLEETSRDIVDESDENFNVKFELIYTMGAQRQIELGPERWSCIAEILEMVRDLVPRLALTLPDSFQVEEGSPGSFPLIRILQPNGGALLIAEVARRICQTGINGLPIATQTSKVKAAVLAYITEWDIRPEDKMTVEDELTGFWSETIQPRLLLLRGLLAGGVLLFALSRKRWCVNYGLNLNREPRTRLAVPYRAKDQPSPRADFSHPDVVIILTFLTYYYSGLTEENLFSTFECLLGYDQRDSEYGEWIKDLRTLPLSLRCLQAINLKDRATCTSVVFPELRKVKGVVDFFLSRIVFPKELRVFPEKLSASGWDIGRVKTNPTTAFSGTCDTHLLLPLSVDFLPLSEQQHTNALVLDHLLQPENAVCRLPDKPAGSDADWVISTIMSLSPSPRVILDVGAQLLELSNLEMAQAWLSKHTSESAEAAIFFDDQDELCVVDREHNVESLRASPLLERLEACLVFLDEAHTRGTDLRLPTDYRAAVTLGPNLTKDRLIQACMRMRKLGQGQTVIFAIPPEIQLKILESRCKPPDANITVSDVLRWAISETHADLRRSMPLWASQGKSYMTRQALWSSFSKESALSSDQASCFLEAEAKSLEQRYRPRLAGEGIDSSLGKPEAVHDGIVARCQLIDQSGPLEAALDEEQEKELSPEREGERHVQRPAALDPAEHVLHPDVIAFASSGVITENPEAFIPAFASLEDMSATSLFDVNELVGKAEDVLVTRDFSRTVKKPGTSYTSDDFLRSPQWILTPTNDANARLAVILSPYEAQQLIPTLRSGSATVLRIYKPHWNTQYPALDRLDFISYPFDRLPQTPTPVTMTQLNLFAGRVNFSSQDEYQDTCHFLNLACDDPISSPVALDGFILHGKPGITRLSSSPVAFMKALTYIRAHHRDLAKTHVAKLFAGVRLRI